MCVFSIISNVKLCLVYTESNIQVTLLHKGTYYDNLPNKENQLS